MTPIAQLRASLCDLFNRVNSGDENAETARALAEVARNIISSCKVEIEYAHLCGRMPQIEYLNAQAESEAP